MKTTLAENPWMRPRKRWPMRCFRSFALRRRRPAKGSYPDVAEWSEDDLGERAPSDKKLRRARRELDRGRAAAEEAAPGAPGD